jgi:hypothetical protein
MKSVLAIAHPWVVLNDRNHILMNTIILMTKESKLHDTETEDDDPS